MSQRFARLALLGLGISIAPAAWGQQIKIGDPAPPISFSDWIKGEPVDLAKTKGKKVVLMEFWATWCPPCIQSIPHLTELQHKYGKDGLIVMGAARTGMGETLRGVKRFVAGRGEAMDYTVAFDDSGNTHTRYMNGVGAGGIPYAFLIDRENRIVWHGHPADPQMDEIIGELVKGEFDVAQAVVRDQLAPMFGLLHRYAALQDWPAFKSQVKEILSKDPGNNAALNAMVYVYCMETDDEDGLRELVAGHIDKYGDNGKVMNDLAEVLLDIADMDKRQPQLALKAASAAYRADKGGDVDVVGTYARALFEIGLVDRAIELQSKAIALANGNGEKNALERILKYYKDCKTLQSDHL